MGAALLALSILGLILLMGEGEPSKKDVSIRTFEAGDAPLSVAVGAEVWIANGAAGTLSHFPPDDPSAMEEIEIGGAPSQIALGRDEIWVAYPLGNSIRRVVTTTGEAEPDVKVGRTPATVAADETGAYFAALDAGSIWYVSGSEARELAGLQGSFPSAIAIGFGSLWVADVVADQVLRIDPATGDVDARVDVGTAPTAIAVGDDAVWVSNFNDATVSRIDPDTDDVSGDPVILGGKPGSLAFGLGYVWVTRTKDDTVIRIDTATNEWTGEVFEVGDNPTGIAVGAGHVWVTNTGDDTITRLTPDD